MPFALRVPPEVHFGKGEVQKLPEIVARFGRRAFVVTGSRPAPVPFADAEIAAALQDVPDLDRLRADLGVPSMRTFGLSPDQIPAVIAGSRAGSMNYNPITLTDSELEQILRDAI